MLEFKRAVETDMKKKAKRTNPTTFPHWGTEVTFYEPTDGQMMLMLSMGGRTMPKEAASNFVQIFLGLADEPTREYIEGLMIDPESGFELKAPGGVFDIWDGLVKEWSGKAKKPQSGSASSRQATGSTSTGTTRRRVSTSSRSRSTAS